MTSFTSDDQLAALTAVADRAASQQDLAHVIGANSADYIRRARGFAWHWPAALVPVPWLLYRKMYPECFLYLAVVTLFPLALSNPVLTPGLSQVLLLTLFLGLRGHMLYRHSALRRIRKADNRELPGARRTRYLTRAGGVSWPGAVLGVLVTACLATYMFAPAILANNCAFDQLPC